VGHRCCDCRRSSSTAGPAAGPAATRWLVAAASHRQLGMSYAEACDVLSEVPPSVLDEFAADLKAGGQEVVASSPRLTVLDSTTEQPGVYLRSLHFNDRLDYVQSCIRVHGAPGCPAQSRTADHSQPPPAHGATATHLHMLLVAVGLHQVVALAEEPKPKREQQPLRVAVLGAGGCSVPGHLATALRLPSRRPAEIHAVELDEEVVAAARDCFGIAALEAADSATASNTDTGANTLRVHGSQCALAWVGEAAEPIDVLIVDLQGGAEENDGASGHERAVHAPPTAATGAAFLRDVAQVVGLSRPGVVAFNCIATPAGLARIEQRVRCGFATAMASPREGQEKETGGGRRNSTNSIHGSPSHLAKTKTDDDLQGLSMWTVEVKVGDEPHDEEEEGNGSSGETNAQQGVLHRLLLVQLGDGGQQSDGSVAAAAAGDNDTDVSASSTSSDSQMGHAIMNAMNAVGLCRPARFVIQECRR
jgi:hypothetical protein